MAFQAYISNFIPFGQEMADRNDAEVCSTEVINENQSVQEQYFFGPLWLIDVVVSMGEPNALHSEANLTIT